MDTQLQESSEFFLGLTTHGGQDNYPLPNTVGDILEVTYVAEGEERFLVLEFPPTASYFAIAASNGDVRDAEEVRRVLKSAHRIFSYSPVWYRLEDRLYVYPVPVNDGEMLRVRCLPSNPTLNAG